MKERVLKRIYTSGERRCSRPRSIGEKLDDQRELGDHVRVGGAVGKAASGKRRGILGGALIYQRVATEGKKSVQLNARGNTSDYQLLSGDCEGKRGGSLGGKKLKGGDRETSSGVLRPAAVSDRTKAFALFKERIKRTGALPRQGRRSMA